MSKKQCARKILSILVQKIRANKQVLFGFDQFQCGFLSTCFLARGLALFQQFLDDAGSLDGKMT